MIAAQGLKTIPKVFNVQLDLIRVGTVPFFFDLVSILTVPTHST